MASRDDYGLDWVKTSAGWRPSDPRNVQTPAPLAQDWLMMGSLVIGVLVLLVGGVL